MSRLSAGAVLLALSSAAAHAQPQTPQWSVVFDDGQGVYSPTAADGVRAGNEGAIVNLIRSAASLTPLGQRRWRLGAAELCAASTDTVYVDAVEALPGGEAWVLRRCLGPTGSVPQYGLLRLAADGAVIASTDVGPMPDQSGRARLIAQSGDVVALVPRNGGLRWLHVGPDGQILSDAFNALPGPENYSVAILNAKLWPNGSASVATRQFRSCTTSPPESCPQAAHTLLRLNTDGTERWRFEAGAMSTFIGFDEDGSSLIAQSPSGAPLMLRQVSAAGVPGTPFVAAGGEVMTLSGAAGPVRGRYLAHSDTEHLLLDRDGAVLVRRPQMGSAGVRARIHYQRLVQRRCARLRRRSVGGRPVRHRRCRQRRLGRWGRPALDPARRRHRLRHCATSRRPQAGAGRSPLTLRGAGLAGRRPDFRRSPRMNFHLETAPPIAPFTTCDKAYGRTS